jgi:glycosyltransferase involved in cell wall biosynthesis
MRIVIDFQGAQSAGSRQRGIGRYSMALIKAMVVQRGQHEILLALNELFTDTVEPIRAAFEGLLPQEQIRVWRAPGPVNSLDPDNVWRRRCAELVREAFLTSLKPDIVLVSSLFEGLEDNAVTSIGMLTNTVPTAVILYDLIPFIHRRPYLDSPIVESWYENKLTHLRRADLLLAISESSRQEAIRCLGFPAEAAINISTAVDPQFRPRQIDKYTETTLRRRYALERPFVMYTGGIDHRKNIEGLIRSYARLPRSLREAHQLAVVCLVDPPSRAALETLARKQGLAADDLVLTGFVPEQDLLALYNLCKLFVFPSWHEGFGLPALEAMSCGRAVIGAKTSSLPEVIGREDALFDPRNDASMADKLQHVLVDDKFRAELEQHGLEQATRFSWEMSARRAIDALAQFHARRSARALVTCVMPRRSKLAYLSPLPPERSGISDYSAELLPELSRHYEIDVVVAQDVVSDPWARANCQIRSVEWFRANAAQFDRVLYHFGNSAFHQHMFGLLEEIPGVIVLHDFFLSHIVAHMDATGSLPGVWAAELYRGHGYPAIVQRFHANDPGVVVWRYPCNRSVLDGARGVIVHSENSRRLAEQWYGRDVAQSWTVIPLLRMPALDTDRVVARRALGLEEDDFLICCFGMIGPQKLNHRVLNAWLSSALVSDKKCVLVFVGEISRDEYGAELLATISRSGLGKRIRVTGWTNIPTFRRYLAAADLAVQLRTLSLGETSAAVLDCMNYGVPTIVNANGSMADLSNDAVHKLPDEFRDVELTAALESLRSDGAKRKELGAKAREILLSRHAPRVCADQYAEAIEATYRRTPHQITTLARSLAQVEPTPTDLMAWTYLAVDISRAVPSRLSQRQLLVDISVLVQTDARTGVQRVVRSILKQLISHPPDGFRVEPIYATGKRGYQYARSFTLRFLDCPESALVDAPIEFRSGDVFLGLDLAHHVVPSHRLTYEAMRRGGVTVWFVIYDLLPILRPDLFAEQTAKLHQDWLTLVVACDGAVCISKAVAAELSAWLRAHGEARLRPFKIASFSLGADIANSVPSIGLPDDAKLVLDGLSARPTFLMVGTLEPRKSHLQVLSAFEQLWDGGTDVNLVIVGKEGWMMEKLAQQLRQHSKLGQQLFWLEGISDEYLETIYATSTCLIAASEGEGFGLPLIEAAQHKLPIIARDLPVFREVAGENAHYFSGSSPEALSAAVREWLSLNAEGKAPSSERMHWLTWAESTEQLLKVILEGAPETFRTAAYEGKRHGTSQFPTRRCRREEGRVSTS